MLDGGRDIVELGVTRARERVPGLKVTGEQTGGQPAKVLIERARDARMVVTGSRGAGRLTGLVLGSVAMQVASHAHCPAVVVRASKPSVYREVVVGVDGSTGSSDAVAFAFEEASLRGVRLRALLAWSSPVSTGPGTCDHSSTTVTLSRWRRSAFSARRSRDGGPSIPMSW